MENTQEELMLIEQSYDIETRVAVVKGKTLQEFDCEIVQTRAKKGNIYLAKIVRIEPALQAAFVDYGGERHGFLAFSEIHPDYFHISAEEKHKMFEARRKIAIEDKDSVEDKEHVEDEDLHEDGEHALSEHGSKDDNDDGRRRPKRGWVAHPYRIQDVLKRHQIVLVQVLKDSRGTKGAALTTYISLAGRYSVLMPNTPKGKGISRKIVDKGERQKLRKIMESLEVPDDMGMIVRTAGGGCTKSEIKRDYDYLMRLWSNIREKVVSLTAPALISEEKDLVMRALRDLYTPNMEKILIHGEDAFKKAKSFMRMFMPSHAKRIQLYCDPRIGLFQKYGVEQQIENIHNTKVDLPSGGAIVINVTEALVAIDVNSARAVQTRNFDSMALKTNMEGAVEVARQLRLRNLSGLIVIDFIDMSSAKHRAQVENQLKEALVGDKACIQLGKIGPFGLMEMSRQRVKQSVSEKSNTVCPNCNGLGSLPSIQFSSLSLLRNVEHTAASSINSVITIHTIPAIADYVLNEQRTIITNIEKTHGVSIFCRATSLSDGSAFRIDVLRTSECVARNVEAIDVMADEPEDDGLEREGTEESAPEGRIKKRVPRRREKRDTEKSFTTENDISEEDAAGKEPQERGKRTKRYPTRRTRESREDRDKQRLEQHSEQSDRQDRGDRKDDRKGRRDREDRRERGPRQESAQQMTVLDPLPPINEDAASAKKKSVPEKMTSLPENVHHIVILDPLPSGEEVIPRRNRAGRPKMSSADSTFVDTISIFVPSETSREKPFEGSSEPSSGEFPENSSEKRPRTKRHG